MMTVMTGGVNGLVTTKETPMFKYKLQQVIYYMQDNKVHSAKVLSRKYVDNVFPKEKRYTKEQEQFFAQLGNEGIMYATCHGFFREDEVFGRLKELKASL